MSKTAHFTYEAYNKDGQKVTGTLQAPDAAQAKIQLLGQDLRPVSVKRQSTLFQKKQLGSPVKAADIATFSRQMATMMSAGVPVVQSFGIVADGADNPQLAILVNQIKHQVESGHPLAEALRAHPKYFSDLYCSLVASGELSGTLETMLDRIATYLEKSESLKRKIKKAMFYPTAIVTVAIIVSAILLIYVVPQFEAMFQDFGADLPAFTLMVIGISNVLQDIWWIILIGLIVLSWAFIRLYRRYEQLRHAMDRLLLRLPIIGGILHKAAVARFSRTLSITFAAGVPLVEALDATSTACGNVVYANAVQQIKEVVSTGTRMQSAMRQTKQFPSMLVQMVSIGEEAGSLDDMLGRAAHIYEEEVDTAVDGLSSLLEPVIMVVLGVIIGSLVIAMYLPIFTMGQAI